VLHKHTKRNRWNYFMHILMFRIGQERKWNKGYELKCNTYHLYFPQWYPSFHSIFLPSHLKYCHTLNTFINNCIIITISPWFFLYNITINFGYTTIQHTCLFCMFIFVWSSNWLFISCIYPSDYCDFIWKLSYNYILFRETVWWCKLLNVTVKRTQASVYFKEVTW
jgi:hypothetical protein